MSQCGDCGGSFTAKEPLAILPQTGFVHIFVWQQLVKRKRELSFCKRVIPWGIITPLIRGLVGCLYKFFKCIQILD